MNTKFLAVILIVIGLSTPGLCQDHCCAPDTYEVKASVADVTGAVITSASMPRLSMDFNKKMIAIKETIHGKTDINITVIVDYNKHVSYSIIDSLQICTKSPVGDMIGKCLPPDAKFLGQVALGDGSLIAENWSAKIVTPAAKAEAYVSLMVQKKTCIPIQEAITTVTPKGYKTDFMVFFDYSSGIKDPSVFNVPDICNGKTNEKASVSGVNEVASVHKDLLKDSKTVKALKAKFTTL